MSSKMGVLFIDNFDSFTYNLVDEFAKRNCAVDVYRNNVPFNTIDSYINTAKPELIVISPGPSAPRDAGITMKVIENYMAAIPIFGVCLGHQAIIESFGGTVGKAPEVVHGKSCYVQHNGKTIYNGLPNPLQAGRYHSLCGTEIRNLEVTATYNDIVMGVRNKERFIEGVQFHPESILTPQGGRIIENLIQMVNTYWIERRQREKKWKIEYEKMLSSGSSMGAKW